MAISARYYLFEHGRPSRVSKRIIDNLAVGREALPEFANKSAKVVAVIVDCQDGVAKSVLDFLAHIWRFDADGRCQESLAIAGMEALENYEILERYNRVAARSGVVDIRPHLKQKKWDEENRWTLTKEQQDILRADILGSPTRTKSVPLLMTSSVKAPPLTYEAKIVLGEIETKITVIDDELETLSEPALKGLAFAASERAVGLKSPVWSAIAARANRRREILARHRTGKGKWIAYVETTIWEGLSQRVGRSGEILAKEECNSKKEAEAAARRLLAENAKHFSAYVEVQARVETDLEFYEFGNKDDDER